MTADGAPQHDLRLVPAALAGWAWCSPGCTWGPWSLLRWAWGA
jgi:hypothetical protein